MRDRLIVVGASAGGVEALRALVTNLPGPLPVPMVVVVHVSASARSSLPAILARDGRIPVVHATQGQQLARGTIHVAPPDHHVLVHDGHLRLSRGPRVNHHRPAIDPLFMSAARAVGRRAISVLLSGVLDDGTSGTGSIRDAGGTTIAQSPEDALFDAMPLNAIEQVGVDHVLPAAEIAARLVALVEEPVSRAVDDDDVPEDAVALAPVSSDIERELARERTENLSGASGYACPDCHGSLWELHDGGVARFRCRVGHSFGGESLLASMSEHLEKALWAGYRALVESAALAQRLEERSQIRGLVMLADRYRRNNVDARARAETLRSVLEHGQLVTGLNTDE